jgi:phosphonate transport system substrate-binding protein
MFSLQLSTRYFIKLLLLLTIVLSSQVSAKPFVIGKVSDNPKKHYAYLKPMADYLAKNLSQFGYTEGKVLMAKNNKQMIRYLKNKKVDLVTETIFSSVIFKDKANTEFLLRKWKKGQRDYHSIIFVRKDSGINNISDFKGKTIAFEDAGSTSAFFVPAALLLSAGHSLENLDSVRDTPSSNNIGYVFSNEEINTSTWVHKGLVSIGALNNHDWNKEDHLPKKFRQDFKIIISSQDFPRGVELVRAGLEKELKNEIKKLLLNIDSSPDAKFILKSYQKTTKFEILDDEFYESVTHVRKIINDINNQLIP